MLSLFDFFANQLLYIPKKESLFGLSKMLSLVLNKLRQPLNQYILYTGTKLTLVVTYNAGL